MFKYFIEVYDKNENKIQDLTISPGSIKLNNGSTLSAWVVTTQTGPNSSFDSYLNGPQLMSAAGAPYGSLINFNANAEPPYEFKIYYHASGLQFKAIFRKRIPLGSPQIQQPNTGAPAAPYNPYQTEMNQKAIDMLNQMNAPTP